MTNDISQLGKQPIRDTEPCGIDVRDAPDFERLQAEIGKLSNPAATGTVDWPHIERLSTTLLETVGKDVLVASYLAHALLNTRGLPGLADGLRILADLLQTWWEQLHPPLRRLRARRNAIEWLLERTRAHADEHDWSVQPPLPAATIGVLRAALDTIDAVLSEKDGDAPSLRPLKNLVDTIPVEPDPTPVETAPEPATPTPPDFDRASPAAPIAGMPPTLAPPPAFAGTGAPATPDSTESAARALEATLDHLANLAAWYGEAEPADALGFRLRRIAAWAAIEHAPPAADGQTALPGPIAPIRDAFQQLLTRQADQDIVNFAETQLRQWPLWLDLNAASAAALGRLGDAWSAAHREVCDQARALMNRLPGIAQLRFAGGMPFASADTLQWLETLAGTAGASDAALRDPLQPVLARARALAASDDLVGAARCVQQALEQQSGAGARVRLRAALCDILLAHRPGAKIDAFARAVVAEIERYDVAAWDPPLAADALRAAYAILSRDDANASEADALLARIAPLDAAAAVRLVI